MRHKLGAALAAAALIVLVTFGAYLYFTGGKNSAASSSEPIDSVAVLPFVNVENDPNKEYLSEGISESIISSLSRLPELKVMSFNSVLRYKGQQVDPQSVGKALKVRAVLMGRLTQHGDDLSISTELVDVRDNHRLWGEQYNRRLSDIITVQTEIAQQISENLRLRLNSQEKRQIAKHYTDNTKAYELYSLGNYYFRNLTKEGYEKSIESFEQALKADQNYALAYTGLSHAYSHLGLRGLWAAKESNRKTEWAALKAVELDETLAEARSALGYAKTLSWDWTGAERETRRALELDPKSFDANFSYCALLVHLGRPDEAIPYAKQAAELDRTFLGIEAYCYLHMRQYDKAIDLYLEAKGSNPKGDRGNFQLAEAYLGKGMYPEAIAEMQEVIANDNSPERWDRQPILAYAYAVAGRRDEALKILDEQNELSKKGYISPYNFAIIYTGLGDKDRAFEYLYKAYEENAPMLFHVASRPMFDSLHSDPRFADLLRRMNLPPERFIMQ
jgi:TolB-like protein/Tfp pilus assembly protein PilF